MADKTIGLPPERNMPITADIIRDRTNAIDVTPGSGHFPKIADRQTVGTLGHPQPNERTAVRIGPLHLAIASIIGREIDQTVGHQIDVLSADLVNTGQLTAQIHRKTN